MAIGTSYTVVTANEQVSVNTTSYTVTVTASTTAGDCIVVTFINNNTAVTSVTDSAGNPYVLAESAVPSGLHTYVYVAAYGSGGSGTATAALVSGTDTITANFAGTASTLTDLEFLVRACSGVLNTSSAVDAAGTLTATATSASPAVTGGTTLASASEWVLAVIGHTNSTSAASGWSGSFATTVSFHPSGYPFLELAEWVVSATTAVDASCSITSSGKWALAQVALQAASSGTSPAPAAAAGTGVPPAPAASVTLNMTIQGA